MAAQRIEAIVLQAYEAVDRTGENMAESEQRAGSPNFSRREWMMLIAIISVIEAWILNASYAFQSEQAVINYVSFAATIASLLLAVIAIIYGYFQSDGQQKAAAAISNQIESMRSIQKELNQASEGISTQLSGMTSTAAELKKLSESLEGTHQTLGEMGGSLSGLVSEHRALKEMLSSKQLINETVRDRGAGGLSEVVSKENVVRILFGTTSFDLDLFGVALYGLLDKNNGVTESWIEFVDKHYAMPIFQPEKPGSLMKYTTIGYEFMLISRSFGLVTLDTGSEPSLKVSEEIRDALKRVVANAMSSEHTRDRAALIYASFK